jgi:hypothetical protein
LTSRVFFLHQRALTLSPGTTYVPAFAMMTLPARIASRLRAARCASNCTRTLATVSNTSAEQQWPQKQPLGDYYRQILNSPSPYPFTDKPEEPPSTADPGVLPPSKKPSPPKQSPERKPQTATATAAASSTSPQVSTTVSMPPPSTAEEAARRIFGTRLYGDEEKAKHAADKQSKSTSVGGIMIPPRPDEPDNCCMSGCVHCVWDLYREDMEEWAGKVKDAEAQMAKAATESSAEAKLKAAAPGEPSKVEEAAKSQDVWDEGNFQGVPLGIREFMKLEKQLKGKHAQDQATSG